eukprot:CAMPEP_0117575454 /NCGR_PEP_ID=MMETSP0784-20121206/62208_1 /TAXON_ID=39447 /ORGANISM="" /LENGTH=143 /DNA_ID=CAMNT_0005374511 /DNA_START=21 /DNA_END=448 /DNA_ORIENTATION=+
MASQSRTKWLCNKVLREFSTGCWGAQPRRVITKPRPWAARLRCDMGRNSMSEPREKQLRRKALRTSSIGRCGEQPRCAALDRTPCGEPWPRTLDRAPAAQSTAGDNLKQAASLLCMTHEELSAKAGWRAGTNAAANAQTRPIR